MIPVSSKRNSAGDLFHEHSVARGEKTHGSSSSAFPVAVREKTSYDCLGDLDNSSGINMALLMFVSFCISGFGRNDFEMRGIVLELAEMTDV
jgi:hypothetical protein